MLSPISLYGNTMLGDFAPKQQDEIFEPRTPLSSHSILQIKKSLGAKALKAGFVVQVDYVLNHLTEHSTQDFLLARIAEVKPNPIPPNLQPIFKKLDKLANSLPRAQPNPKGYTPNYDGVVFSCILDDSTDLTTGEDEMLVSLDEVQADQPLLGGAKPKRNFAQRVKRSFSK